MIKAHFQDVEHQSVIEGFASQRVYIPGLQQLRTDILFCQELGIPLLLFHTGHRLRIISKEQCTIRQQAARTGPQYHLIRKPGVINQVMRNTTNLVLAQKLRPVELVPGSYKNILSPSVTIFSHSIISISNQSIRVPASTGIHFSFQITPDERCCHKIHRMFLHLIV